MSDAETMVGTRQYDCLKCKKNIVTTVYLCDVCDMAYHPGCGKFHKVKNQKGELVNCYGNFKVVQLNRTEMEVDSWHNDKAQDETMVLEG